MTRSLQHEIGKSKPFDVLAQEVYLNLLRTASVLGGEFDRFFRPFGLSNATYNALRIVRGHGSEGVATQVIGKQLVSPVPDVTRLVDRLVRAGLVERCRVTSDRRVVMVKITAKGRELLGDLDQRVLDLHRSQLAHMSAADQQRLNELLFVARQRDGDPAGGADRPARGETPARKRPTRRST